MYVVWYVSEKLRRTAEHSDPDSRAFVCCWLSSYVDTTYHAAYSVRRLLSADAAAAASAATFRVVDQR